MFAAPGVGAAITAAGVSASGTAVVGASGALLGAAD